MGALDSVLDRADAATGQHGEARSWLLPLLKQGAPALATSSAFPPEPLALVPPTPLVTSTLDLVPEAETEEPAIAAQADEPSVPEASPQEPALPPAPLDIAGDTPWPSVPPAASPIREHAPFERLKESVKATASADLDQAFAPLEIAFPPLPPSERTQADAPAVPPPSSVPLPFFSSLRAPSAREQPFAPDEPSGSSGCSEIQDPSKLRATETRDPQPIAPAAAGDREASPEAASGVDPAPAQELLPEDFLTGHAAPVPTFQVEAFETSVSRPSEAPEEEKPPAPRTLDAWRAWLPGRFRSRSRP
jgi:hypothetical protein